MKNKQRNVLVLYGGVTPEHEVAIITALQVMKALEGAGHNVLPGYISKNGEWRLGNKKYLDPKSYEDLELIKNQGKKFFISPDRSIQFISKSNINYKKDKVKIDVVFPVFHGRNGEDGAVQGLLNLANIPYVGCGLVSSSVGIDKYIAKKTVASLGIKTVKDLLLTKSQWKSKNKKVVNTIKALGLPVFLKPNSLGSSIGIKKVNKWNEFKNAIEVALMYDSRILIEKAIKNPKEVNISILGNDPYQLSVTEQPIGSKEILSFKDKYLSSSGKKDGTKSRGMASASRIIPADISDSLKQQIEESSVKIFRAFGGRGISRIDYMIEKNNLYFNEINTLPGSLAFYLWEKTGISFSKLVDKLVSLAIESWQEKQRLISSFESNILAGYSSSSAKGS